ncbi:MAG: phage portal protein [Buchananella hordeovulneris]|nr:phage portal protein [Buchananella hordeovulneris]
MPKLLTSAGLMRAIGGAASDPGPSYTVVDPPFRLRDWDDHTGVVPLSDVWRAQPAIRTVVEYIARTIATIPLHVYRREPDGGRTRVRTGPVADALAVPSPLPGQGAYRFWFRLLVDLLIYDRWLVAVLQDGPRPELVRIPPRRFHLKSDALDRITGIELLGRLGKSREVDPSHYLLDVGYAQNSGAGTSPIATLAGVLREAQQAEEYRARAFTQGAHHTGVIEREEKWETVADRNRFLEGLRAFTAQAERAGGVMLLDDGMKWKDRSADLAMLTDASARALTTIEVANAFHVPPELIGLREGNYSNVESLRQALYRDNLAAEISSLEGAFSRLVEILQPGEGLYIEAAVEAKLRGAFEQQARYLQAAVGGPWLSRNEARARMNLPAIDGADELIVPLNVVEGGQASPLDAGTQNIGKTSAALAARKSVVERVLVKSADLEAGDYHAQAAAVLARFFDRQAASVLSALGAKATWWDQSRWDRELSADLNALATRVVAQMGPDALAAMGVEPERWDQDAVIAYLAVMSRHRAKWINEATYRALLAAIEADGVDPREVFERAKNSRTKSAAGALIAALGSFAAVEAGSKHGPPNARKVWLVRSGNPRASHAAMHGDSARLHDAFSNGMQWPGDPAGGADEVAGCRCGVAIMAAQDVRQ